MSNVNKVPRMQDSHNQHPWETASAPPIHIASTDMNNSIDSGKDIVGTMVKCGPNVYIDNQRHEQLIIKVDQCVNAEAIDPVWFSTPIGMYIINWNPRENGGGKFIAAAGCLSEVIGKIVDVQPDDETNHIKIIYQNNFLGYARRGTSLTKINAIQPGDELTFSADPSYESRFLFLGGY